MLPFPEDLYLKGLTFFLAHLEYLKSNNHSLYQLIIKNPQCFNEVICETSLSFLASEIENHPLNGKFDTCEKIWQTITTSRKKTEDLKDYVGIKFHHSTFDCKKDDELIQKMKHSFISIFRKILKNSYCLAPSFVKGNINFIPYIDTNFSVRQHFICW